MAKVEGYAEEFNAAILAADETVFVDFGVANNKGKGGGLAAVITLRCGLDTIAKIVTTDLAYAKRLVLAIESAEHATPGVPEP